MGILRTEGDLLLKLKPIFLIIIPVIPDIVNRESRLPFLSDGSPLTTGGDDGNMINTRLKLRV
jgi:hypothetical protein